MKGEGSLLLPTPPAGPRADRCFRMLGSSQQRVACNNVGSVHSEGAARRRTLTALRGALPTRRASASASARGGQHDGQKPNARLSVPTQVASQTQSTSRTSTRCAAWPVKYDQDVATFMCPLTLHEVLGLPDDATPLDIRKAHRILLGVISEEVLVLRRKICSPVG